MAMKRFFLNLMLLGMISLVFASCNKEVIEKPVEEGDVFIVQLGWGGELDVDYEPLTRAAADDLYGIQIYSAPDKELEEGATPTWTPYAHGLFDGSAGISAKLQKGYKYRFVASMVRDGNNKIGGDGTGFSYPFYMFKSGSPAGIFAVVDDEFTYDIDYVMNYLTAGTSSLLPNGTMYSVPNTDRYYGELENFVPSNNNSNVNIRMKRASFGAKFITEGQLATSGTLKVQIAGAPEMALALTGGDDQINDIFTFSDVLAAYNENDYKQTLGVNLIWERNDGTTFPMGTHEITYKRNATTVVTIAIDNDGTDSGISFDIDDSETGEMPEADDLNVNIKDGEVVEEEAEEVVFDESRYILYKFNRSGKVSGSDYYYYASQIKAEATGSVMEMKFKLADTSNTDAYLYLASAGNLEGSSSRLYIIPGSNNNPRIKYKGQQWYLSDFGISSYTDLITLRISSLDNTITLNGITLSTTEAQNMGWVRLFSAYYSDRDDGLWSEEHGVPTNSQLYYVKLFDAEGNLTYLGHAAKGVNPETGNTEYCWYSNANGVETRQFARDARNKGGYGGNF